MAKNWSATSPMTRTERLLFGVLFSIMYVVSKLPFCALYILSDFVYVIVYKVLGYRKKIVRKNLRKSFPEKDDEELKCIERGYYHYFCDYIFETIKMLTISKKEMKKHVQFGNLDCLRKWGEEGRSVSLYLAHYCNWEWVTSINIHLSDCFKISHIYHVLESKVMDRLLLRVRATMGSEGIPANETLRRLVTYKRDGVVSCIGFISDQSPILYNVPYWTDFQHQSTPFITGTERLTKQLNMACAYLDIRRLKRGYYQMDVIPIATETKGIDDWQLTERYARLLEQTILRQPELWLWSHNRWKRSPDDYKNAVKKGRRNE